MYNIVSPLIWACIHQNCLLSPLIYIPLPQDEDYARQLQFEFDTNLQSDVTALLQTVSNMLIYTRVERGGACHAFCKMKKTVKQVLNSMLKNIGLEVPKTR